VEKTKLEQWVQAKVVGAAASGGTMLTRDMIWAYQLQKLRETVSWARSKSSFYSKRLADFPAKRIDRLQALQQMPFTTAEDIAANPQALVCCSQDEVHRIVTMASSGTTGTPKRLFFTEEDQELTKDFFHHALSVVAQPGDRVLVMLPGNRPGSVGDLFAESARRMHVEPVPYGFVTDVEAALAVVERERVNLLLGTPVQVLALASWENPAKPRFQTDIRNVILNTDNLPLSIVERIRQKWNCRVFNHYAMTEMGLAGGMECEAFAGYHMREADLLFEIVDIDTGEPLPDGQEGEVVFTTLTRRAMPLIRYRTGDISRFLPEPCPCKSILKRLAPVRNRVQGQAVLANGGVLTMSALDEELFAVDGVLNFDAQLSSSPRGDVLSLHVQVANWVDGDIADLICIALQAVPVVAENEDNGQLVIDKVVVEPTEKLWSPGKRLLKDNRQGVDGI